MENARENISKIAQSCGITPSAVLKRIGRMKEDKIIVGTYLLVNPEEVFGDPYWATVLVDAGNMLETDAKVAIRRVKNVIICAESIGRFNLCALILGYDMKELNATISEIKNIRGVNGVAVNIWMGKPYLDFARDLRVMEG